MIAKFHQPKLSVSFQGTSFGASTGSPVAREFVERDPYEGVYTVTPSETEQTLLTNNLRMTGNVTIGAIPNNYGLITWDGTTLTVS